MPERVKTKLDNDDDYSDRQPTSHKKRKAGDAFESKSSPVPVPTPAPMPAKVLKVTARPNGKVVYFGDNDLNGTAKTAAEPTRNNYAKQGARLKQRATELLCIRQKLPIYTHANEIREKIRNNDVLLLVGETGSGKSTQVPQFLLDQTYAKLQGAITSKERSKPKKTHIVGRIAITQPRRVAAISLARRVAEEVGTPLGSSSPASQVGYSVRFDNSTSPSTKIKFVTDGMLLQELLRDPWLKEYSVVIVDEVHERGVNVDLVLGFLKRIIQRCGTKEDGRNGVPLKVVVMSATADMEKIQSFFSKEIDQNGDSETGNAGEIEKKTNGRQSSPILRSVKTISCSIKGRMFPVTIHYTPQAVPNSLDAAMERIINIHTHTPLPGDILVFLPGQETIDSLESMCNNYAATLQAQSKQKGAPRLPKLLILPLFAALPTTLQQRVFEQTPPFTRKIILSTNIAETSVTVPGIRHVIDTGKRKARFFRPSLNLDTLLTKPISRSSANQRTGRAGREAPGTCYRLYTEKTFYELPADTEPEILRCNLSQLVLTLKTHEVDDILAFPLLTQPPIKALERALLHLLRLKALDRKEGRITASGRRMSALPLPANLARILLASTSPKFNCLDQIIDIVAGLSVENIWLPIHNSNANRVRQTNPVTANQDSTSHDVNRDGDGDDDNDETRSPIHSARQTLYRREGDHLTLLAAIQAYVAENTDRKEWCRRHAISHRAMSAAMDVRKQLIKLMAENKSRLSMNEPKTDQKTKGKNVDKIDVDLKGDQKNKMDNSISTTANEGTTTTPEPRAPNSTTSETINTRILRCLLTGLKENTARLNPNPHFHQQQSTSKTQHPSSSHNSSSADPKPKEIFQGPYQTYYTAKQIQIHPSSVLFDSFLPATSTTTTGGRGEGGGGTTKPANIMFSEFVFTARPYARVVSAVEGWWLDEVDQDDEDVEVDEENGSGDDDDDEGDEDNNVDKKEEEEHVNDEEE